MSENKKKLTKEELRKRERIHAVHYMAVIHGDEGTKPISNEQYVKVEGHLIGEKDAEYMRINLYERLAPANEEKHSAYLDRMRQWDSNKFQRALSKCKERTIRVGNSLSNAMVGDIEAFLSEYNGYPCRLIKVYENKGYDGYYYTELVWVKETAIQKPAKKESIAKHPIIEQADDTENKYNCGAYDEGYCYSFARPLTDAENQRCEYTCCCYNPTDEEDEKKGE